MAETAPDLKVSRKSWFVVPRLPSVARDDCNSNVAVGYCATIWLSMYEDLFSGTTKKKCTVWLKTAISADKHSVLPRILSRRDCEDEARLAKSWEADSAPTSEDFGRRISIMDLGDI